MTRKNIFLLLLLAVFFSLVLIHIPTCEAGEYEDKELARIKESASYVKRDGDTLYLRLKSASYATFVNLPGCAGWGSCRIYEFLDYFTDVGFYHLSLYSGEIAEYLMISSKTGETYWVYDYAHISPDRKRFVSVNGGSVFADGGISIGRFEQGKIVYELERGSIEEGAWYGFVAWKDNETILLSKHTHSDTKFCPESSYMTMLVKLKLDKDNWEFEEEMTNDTVKCSTNSKD